MRLSLVYIAALAQCAASAAALKSVLMICVDDLRPQLSVYPEGGPGMHTPNIERIAAKGVVFERAYVQVALCMPSRTSLLTSRRPDTSRSWTIEADQWFRLSGGNFTTLPQHLRNNGYFTIGMGKIFHEQMPASDPQDYVLSWSPEAVFKHGGQKDKGGLFDPAGKGKLLGGAGKLAHRFPDELEPELQDGNLTDHALGEIAKLANGTYGTDIAELRRPFFLAIGLHKPHVPWWAPARFWDLYPLEKVPPVPHPGLVTNNVAVSMQDWQVRGQCGDTLGHSGNSDMAKFCGPKSAHGLSDEYPLDNTTVPADGRQYMRQAYFASVSWTDANIGRILDAFEATPFAKDTVIAFWGDHGWHLGDNNLWEKMTNYEAGTKIPLIIGCTGDGCALGKRSPALVEAIDIMPTLLQEAGLPILRCPTDAAESRRTALCTEGHSLSALLRDPADVSKFVADAAYSQFPRPEHPQENRMQGVYCRSKGLTKYCPLGWCNDTAAGECPNKMGYTIRTDNYRYTAWVGFNKCQNSSCPAELADWDTVYGVELYNHSLSPVPSSYDMETVNIAGLPGSAATVELLHAKVKTFNSAK